jgi:hypothetical protein
MLPAGRGYCSTGIGLPTGLPARADRVGAEQVLRVEPLVPERRQEVVVVLGRPLRVLPPPLGVDGRGDDDLEVRRAQRLLLSIQDLAEVQPSGQDGQRDAGRGCGRSPDRRR